MAVIMADINTVPGPSALMPAVQLSPRQQRDPMAAGGTADSGDPEQDRLEATELAKAGNHCLAGGDLDGAVNHYRDAVALARSCGDVSLVAVLLASRSEIYYANGEYALALADARCAALALVYSACACGSTDRGCDYCRLAAQRARQIPAA